MRDVKIVAAAANSSEAASTTASTGHAKRRARASAAAALPAPLAVVYAVRATPLLSPRAPPAPVAARAAVPLPAAAATHAAALSALSVLAAAAVRDAHGLPAFTAAAALQTLVREQQAALTATAAAAPKALSVRRLRALAAAPALAAVPADDAAAVLSCPCPVCEFARGEGPVAAFADAFNETVIAALAVFTPAAALTTPFKKESAAGSNASTNMNLNALAQPLGTLGLRRVPAGAGAGQLPSAMTGATGDSLLPRLPRVSDDVTPSQDAISLSHGFSSNSSSSSLQPQLPQWSQSQSQSLSQPLQQHLQAGAAGFPSSFRSAAAPNFAGERADDNAAETDALPGSAVKRARHWSSSPAEPSSPSHCSNGGTSSEGDGGCCVELPSVGVAAAARVPLPPLLADPRAATALASAPFAAAARSVWGPARRCGPGPFLAVIPVLPAAAATGADSSASTRAAPLVWCKLPVRPPTGASPLCTCTSPLLSRLCAHCDALAAGEAFSDASAYAARAARVHTLLRGLAAALTSIVSAPARLTAALAATGVVKGAPAAPPLLSAALLAALAARFVAEDGAAEAPRDAAAAAERDDVNSLFYPGVLDWLEIVDATVNTGTGSGAGSPTVGASMLVKLGQRDMLALRCPRPGVVLPMWLPGTANLSGADAFVCAGPRAVLSAFATGLDYTRRVPLDALLGNWGRARAHAAAAVLARPRSTKTFAPTVPVTVAAQKAAATEAIDDENVFALPELETTATRSSRDVTTDADVTISPAPIDTLSPRGRRRDRSSPSLSAAPAPGVKPALPAAAAPTVTSVTARPNAHLQAQPHVFTNSPPTLSTRPAVPSVPLFSSPPLPSLSPSHAAAPGRATAQRQRHADTATSAARNNGQHALAAPSAAPGDSTPASPTVFHGPVPRFSPSYSPAQQRSGRSTAHASPASVRMSPSLRAPRRVTADVVFAEADAGVAPPSLVYGSPATAAADCDCARRRDARLPATERGARGADAQHVLFPSYALGRRRARIPAAAGATPPCRGGCGGRCRDGAGAVRGVERGRRDACRHG